MRQEVPEEVPRRWKITMKPEVLHSIKLQREKYERYLKTNNNTANREVWRVYDHVAEDLFAELLGQALGQAARDMEAYCEKVILDEFQIPNNNA